MSLFQREFYKGRKFGHIGDGSNHWRNLTAQEQAHFNQRAAEITENHIKSSLPQILSAYRSAESSTKVKSYARGLLIKHFGMPKTPLNPFLNYCRELISANPNLKYFSPEMQSAWKKLGDSDREKYLEAFQNELQAHKRQTTEFLQRMERSAEKLRTLT